MDKDKDPLQNEIEKRDELIEDMEDEFYDPIDNLEPKEQKYILKKVTTSLPPSKIARSLGLSSYKRRQIEQNEHAKNYEKQLMSQYSDKEMKKQEKMQIKWIRDNLMSEFIDRFDDPKRAAKDYFGEEDGMIDATPTELNKFYDRFAKFASFKELIDILKKIDKMRRLDSGEATERTDSSFVAEAREKFEQLKEKEEDYQLFKKEAKKKVETGEISSFEEYEQILDADYEEVKENEEVEEDSEQVEKNVEKENNNKEQEIEDSQGIESFKIKE